MSSQTRIWVSGRGVGVVAMMLVPLYWANKDLDRQVAATSVMGRMLVHKQFR